MKLCQGKCKLDPSTQLCLGCQRSMHDIRQAYKEFLTRQLELDIMAQQERS